MTVYAHAGPLAPRAILDISGHLVRGGDIGLYEVGTDNLADVWTDRDRSTTTANPFTTDAATGNTPLVYGDPREYDLRRIVDGVPDDPIRVEIGVDAEDAVTGPDTSAPLARLDLYTLIPALENMPFVGRGASYEANDFQNTALARAILLFAGRNRMNLVNTALAGAGIDSAVIRAMGNTVNKHVSGNKQLSWVDIIHNTVLSVGFTTDAQKDHLLSNLRSLLACLGSVSRVESSTLTQSGTWTADVSNVWSAGSAMETSQDGAYLEGSITFPASGHVDVVVASVDPASPTGLAFPPSPFSVLVDGVVQGGQQTASGHVIDSPSTVENTGIGRYAAGLDATPGAHTVRIRKDAGVGTTYLFVDCILLRDTNPHPQMLWPMNPVDYAAIAAGYHRTTTQAEVDAANAAQAVLAAEFGNVHVMDITGFDQSTMIGLDGIHPFDKGSRFFANVAQTWGRTLPDLVPGLHTGV